MFRVLFCFKYLSIIYIRPVFKKINFISPWNFTGLAFKKNLLLYLTEKKSNHYSLYLDVVLTKKLITNVCLIFNKFDRFFSSLIIKSVYFKFILKTIWNKFVRKKYSLHWLFIEVIFEHIFLNSSLPVKGVWSSPVKIINDSVLFKGTCFMSRRLKKCRSLRRTYRKKLLENNNRIWYE